MEQSEFYKELERSFKALTRLYNVLKADLFRLENVVGPEGQEIIGEINKVEEALNHELKNLQKLLKLARPKTSR